MLTVLALVAVVAGVLGLVAGVLALRTLGRVRRDVGLLARGGDAGPESIIDVTARHIELTERTQREVTDLRQRVEAELARRPDEVTAGVAATQREVTGRRAAARDDLAAQVAALRSRLDVELGALDAHLSRTAQTIEAETKAERAALAADNSAAREQVRGAVERVETAIGTSLRRVALVRFDGFDDLSGRLSFCLALLDSRGDGIALTSLAGRSDTRLYAKSIVGGAGTGPLSPEEEQAVTAALSV